ncbi:relaxase MobL, partial [Enterococcus faecalis]|uniref:relaxase MobL n=1 Tax=Enterococcus faecalis TaxID=1351 RepID=UPI003D6C2190
MQSYTVNFHVHVGYVEKKPTREWILYKHPKEPSKTGWQFKVKFLQKSIKMTKRTFVNELIQNKEQLSMLETYVTQ